MRFLGKMHRLFWWVALPPVGMVLSWRAGTRRRHRQQLHALAEVRSSVYASRSPALRPPPRRA